METVLKAALKAGVLQADTLRFSFLQSVRLQDACWSELLKGKEVLHE